MDEVEKKPDVMIPGREEEDKEAIPPSEVPFEQRLKAVENLTKAVETEARVRKLALVIDVIEAGVGVVPVLGDGAAAAFNLLYLLYEGHNAGMIDFSRVSKELAEFVKAKLSGKDKDAGVNLWEVMEFLKLQGLDMAMGIIPGAGGAVDLVHMSTVRAVPHFEAHTKQRAEEARRAGVDPAEIERILGELSFFDKVAKVCTNAANKIYRAVSLAREPKEIEADRRNRLPGEVGLTEK